MTNLTEQWKKGELPSGMYYIEFKDGCIAKDVYAFGSWGNINEHFLKQVLAPVPSYEEWQLASEQLNKNGVWYTERSYKELKKEKRALEVLVGNRDNTIQELREENQKLKELLKECKDELEGFDNISEWNEIGRGKLLTKIDEVLNEQHTNIA